MTGRPYAVVTRIWLWDVCMALRDGRCVRLMDACVPIRLSEKIKRGFVRGYCDLYLFVGSNQ